jgi:uncharacterized protein YxeA
MKKTLIFILGILLVFSMQAAARIGDLVMIDGEEHYVRADPLYRYLTTSTTKEMLDEYVETFCEPYDRNYTRYWEVRGRRLYLLKIETNDKKVQYPLERLFLKYDGSPIFASWFSGIMSYRQGDSPLIQLNREYYEKEKVIRFNKGVEIERYTVNHLERWIDDSRRIMDRYRPLKNPPPLKQRDDPSYEPGTVELLENAFSPVMNPEGGPSFFMPTIVIKFNGDLDGFEITEADRELTSYRLLEKIAEKTGSTLNVTVSNRMVIYEIRENEAAGDLPAGVSSAAAQETASASPSE